MLKHLSIKSVAVIDELNIDFSSGLCILSGETGAGKSIIIDAINLLKGERASRTIIRSGEDRARVSGVFETDGAVSEEIAQILGTEAEEEIIISREITSDGKNTIRINGMPANLAMLKSVGERLINIHGQHDNTSLLSQKTHIGFLDSFGGEEIGSALGEYRELFLKCKELSEELAGLDTDEHEKLRRKDMLSFQIAEIDEAALEEGEDEELMARKNILDNAARISDNTMKAYDLLYGSENGTAHDMLWKAISSLEKIADFHGDINAVYEDLTSLADAIDEKIRDLRHIGDGLSFDAGEAQRIDDRLDVIYNLKKKYGATIEDVLAFYEKASEEFEALESSDERIEFLKTELESSKKLLRQKADRLTLIRRECAQRLEKNIMAQLGELNMAKVEFKADISPASSFRPNGADEVEFLVRTNVGEEIKPMTKIASGGELSRIMLAIKSVLSKSDGVRTLIFDEIDTGVSGAAAQKIGEKLHTMAEGRLVLCITHLPQIASMADSHYLIEKEVAGGRTLAKARLLGFEERVDEIARTLGGSTITEAARENARALLERK